MLRTQKKVTNRKKTQSTPSTASKSKGAKFDSNNDKADSNAVHIIKNGKFDDSNGPNKLQGHHNHTSHNMKNDHPSAAAPLKLGDKKLERSNSFFLTRKLSKLYDSLTHSRESLKGTNDMAISAVATTTTTTAPNDSKKAPFKFIRSASLATISLKKDYRSSMRKVSRLEQLSEEDQSMHANAALSDAKRKKDRKKSSTASIDSLSSEKSSIISTFKRTFSLTPSRRKSSNPKWSASLMNLQQIDVMISYEDLSFIDYDKFNTYEENLMTKIKSSNPIDVNRSNVADQFPGVKMRSHPNITLQQQHHHHHHQQQKQQRRHSSIVQRSPMHANVEYTTDNWLNSNSKRWSNPCICSHTDCISAFPFAPSQASDTASRSVIVHPTPNGDECDYAGSQPQSLKILSNSSNPTATAHSVDDLMNMMDERGNPDDLHHLQAVCRSNLIFLLLISCCCFFSFVILL